jgi:hypothetical protein
VVDALAAVSVPGSAGTEIRSATSEEVPLTGTAVKRAPQRTAVQGAAICLAFTGAVVLITASLGRLRRRADAIPGD